MADARIPIQQVEGLAEALGTAGGAVRWEVLVAGNLAEPVHTPDGSDYIYVEVTI